MKPRLDNQIFQPMRRGGCRGRGVCGHVKAALMQTWPQTPRPRHPGRGFTLIELLVVIATIALVLTITLPGIVGLFTAGVDLQARNVISGMLGAARGVAIENQSYALVHVQMGAKWVKNESDEWQLEPDGKCWAAVLQYDNDPTTPQFVPVDGFPPQQMPADMAFGEISESYINDSSYDVAVNTNLKGFTTFNIIFGPDGSLTALVNSATPVIKTTGEKIFEDTDDDNMRRGQIWDPNDVEVEAGVCAITAFHYRTLDAMSDADRLGWLERNGQFLCINKYTGKLLPTK